MLEKYFGSRSKNKLSSDMGVNMSGSNSEVEMETADFTSNIPVGEEHNRCRKALAKKGARVNVRNQDGETPLIHAVKQ